MAAGYGSWPAVLTDIASRSESLEKREENRMSLSAIGCWRWISHIFASRLNWIVLFREKNLWRRVSETPKHQSFFVFPFEQSQDANLPTVQSRDSLVELFKCNFCRYFLHDMMWLIFGILWNSYKYGSQMPAYFCVRLGHPVCCYCRCRRKPWDNILAIWL